MVSRIMRTPFVIMALVLLVSVVGVSVMVKNETVTGQAAQVNVPVIVLPQQGDGRTILQRSSEAIYRQYQQCMIATHDHAIEGQRACNKQCIVLTGEQPDIERCLYRCMDIYDREHKQGMWDCESTRFAPRILIIRQ